MTKGSFIFNLNAFIARKSWLVWLNFIGFGGWMGSQRQQLHQVGYGEAPLLLLMNVYYSDHLFAVLLISARSRSEFHGVGHEAVSHGPQPSHPQLNGSSLPALHV